MSNNAEQPHVEQEEDDEPDEWDKRIFSTGCHGESFEPPFVEKIDMLTPNGIAEQDKMNDCYFAKKDWRECKEEMEAFRECWKQKGNDQRTQTKDA
ncbi:hypothetical protein N7450_000587 [Penicillium hetheringtonii]|uniref:CHCH domain-containing protein n=1 Tax=Penicillium hetheringtonii TaxID=911720 RepID=A0AAD6H2Q9_9EURO|nr:hypothetical protein N7450_000587 [Penicillium hetheringtonii]